MGLFSRSSKKKHVEGAEKVVSNYTEMMNDGYLIVGKKCGRHALSAQERHEDISWYLDEPDFESVDITELTTNLITETDSKWNQEKFARHASSILHGRRPHWVLYGIKVLPTKLIFYYENRKSENMGTITLDFSNTRTAFSMSVQHEKPHYAIWGGYKDNTFQIDYHPEINDGFHVFAEVGETGETYEYNFRKDSTEVHVCYCRPTGLPDR